MVEEREATQVAEAKAAGDAQVAAARPSKWPAGSDHGDVDAVDWHVAGRLVGPGGPTPKRPAEGAAPAGTSVVAKRAKTEPASPMRPLEVRAGPPRHRLDRARPFASHRVGGGAIEAVHNHTWLGRIVMWWCRSSASYRIH
jgi:hypothetical protein